MRFTVIRGGSPVAGHNADAVVPWWSFTKTALAAAALTLVRDDCVQLDVCLEGQPFTPRQLLRHQAGLTDYGYLSDYHASVARNEEPWSVEEMLIRADTHTLRFPPGQGWQYSNIGYLYIRQLIEARTGLGLNAALHRQVFGPLGILRPHIVQSREEWQSALSDHAAYDPGWVYHGLLVGPLADAVTLLDRLLTGSLLPANLLRKMQDGYQFPGPFPGRP